MWQKYMVNNEAPTQVEDADTNSKSRAEEEDSKQQLSPISVLGEIDPDQDSPIYYSKMSFFTKISNL